MHFPLIGLDGPAAASQPEKPLCIVLNAALNPSSSAKADFRSPAVRAVGAVEAGGCVLGDVLDDGEGEDEFAL